MPLIDTTSPGAHAKARSLLGGPAVANAIEMVSRLRLHIVGLYYAEVGPEWDSGGRRESDYLHHIELALAGRRQVVHGDRVVNLEPGSAYLLTGNTPVARRCVEPCRLIFLKFRCEWLPGVDPILDWPERGPRRIGPFNAKAWERWRRPGQVPTANGLLHLRAQIEDWMAQVLPDLSFIISRHIETHAQFTKVFQHIEDRLGADLRVESLARVHSATREAFSMAFVRDVGISPKEYLNRRINQAAIELIITTDRSIKEIAAELRFSDEFYFSRFFQKLNGIPPSMYRLRFRGVA
jgi:AraC-like DNA-binding protein